LIDFAVKFCCPYKYVDKSVVFEWLAETRLLLLLLLLPPATELEQTVSGKLYCRFRTFFAIDCLEDVSEMTYNVSSGTLNLTHSHTQSKKARGFL